MYDGFHFHNNHGNIVIQHTFKEPYSFRFNIVEGIKWRYHYLHFADEKTERAEKFPSRNASENMNSVETQEIHNHSRDTEAARPLCSRS